ncbi:hypothetical protein [Oligoflexus tunisiensis]|uniref:hypothetical protein n=1 Tax=Oligoflexus tunisiensis TaxID=708132 RepID=UPI00114CE2AC|nr:hypothetical protein [Oligoflexus tunisiensis]
MRTINLISCVLLTLGFEMKAENKVYDAGADSAEMKQDPLQMAFDSLKSAEALESPYIGFAAMPSEKLKNLREILGSSEAEPTLLLLYEEGNLVGKMYAIIGLQLLEKTDLAQNLIQDAYKFQADTLRTMDGCVIFDRPLPDLLKEIEAGYYKQLFAET